MAISVKLVNFSSLQAEPGVYLNKLVQTAILRPEYLLDASEVIDHNTGHERLSP